VFRLQGGFTMPNDAKLGMVVGVGLVIIVAVIFFRKDSIASDAFATIPKSVPAVTQPPPRRGSETVPPGGTKVVVQDGDTLMSLAFRYYGATDKFNVIYQANRDQLGAPDRLRPGMTLTIPEAH
jgi:nucleoid-associated protein YgaU